jgi:hypothetical protein
MYDISYLREVKTDKVSPASDTSLTLGDSGDTISIPSGATIANSGTATGFFDGLVWDTTEKTASFSPVTLNGYFVDTSGGEITATLPTSPSAGAMIAFKDYDGSFGTNALIIGRGGSNIQGVAVDSKIDTARASLTLIYVDATEGWVYINESNVADLGNLEYVAATGGTESTVGDYKIHKFTGDGTFTVSNAGNAAGNDKVNYLTVGGGGGGGYSNSGHQGSGGGAGGYRESVPSPAAWTASPLASPAGGITVSATPYAITVGAGGAASGAPVTVASSGTVSTFSSISSAGGGGGGAGSNPGVGRQGLTGGSGGGTGASDQTSLSGGAGNTPPVSPPQGNNGGPGDQGTGFGAQGGGAGAAGVNRGSPPSPYYPGSAGTPTVFTNSDVTYGVGGGSAPNAAGVPSLTANVGMAGAGGKAADGNDGQAGSSGIVVLRYKFQ